MFQALAATDRCSYLVVHCVQLVVKSHGQVGGCARGYVGDEWRLALVHGVIHIHPPLADLHVLEAGLDTVRGEGRKSANQPTNQQAEATAHHSSPGLGLNGRLSTF